MAATVLVGDGEVRAAVGRHLGYSDRLDISADRIENFTQATGDVDATYFAVSLSNMFLPQIVEVRGFAMGINYGTDAVRFPSPLESGVRVRGGAELLAVEDVRGGIQTRMLITVERDDGDPICVIESISRWLS